MLCSPLWTVLRKTEATLSGLLCVRNSRSMLPYTPAQVRQDHDSLTIGAKPFISFLVWPVFSN